MPLVQESGPGSKERAALRAEASALGAMLWAQGVSLGSKEQAAWRLKRVVVPWANAVGAGGGLGIEARGRRNARGERPAWGSGAARGSNGAEAKGTAFVDRRCG
eukprot:CAMPEP_0169470138 /NCGR_PEP_ID=MMETSP1042-20121227/23866_1 /TAXON_ID=464988 /ORGANISM="Hemiselmis andersenii, Strain CCMP1180" /LENGTH=103 /DNA_ID=CAMNT_0009583687 /DNA_START=123 /DNA_END=432 /DNA_ORIENTATION=+